MEINYIILAHKNPDQLKKLVKKLGEPWVNFYIHINKKIEIGLFKSLLRGIQNVCFLEDEKRENTVWGDISIVKGTLNALEEIIADKRTGYCVLLSGQDYPLKSNKHISSFFLKNDNCHFINIFPMPGKWKNEGDNRILKYKVNKSINRGHFLLLPSIYDFDFYKIETAGKIKYLLKEGKWKEISKIFKRRNFPNYVKPFGGSQWWAFPIRTINKILEFIKEHPEYLKYHKYTLIPDEIFFHSIIMYLNEKEPIKIAPSLTYANWKRKSGPLPVTFRIEDFEELETASRKNLFARKFDIDIDESILNRIDDNLLQDESTKNKLSP